MKVIHMNDEYDKYVKHIKVIQSKQVINQLLEVLSMKDAIVSFLLFEFQNMMDMMVQKQ
jgi:hypothetical protein